MKKQIISMKRGAQQGFTLIELMIVVAIIAILAAFALPAYQDYTKRTRVAEGLTLGSSAKVAVTEYYANYNTWPTNNSTAGLAPATALKGNGVHNITLGASGLVHITYDSVKFGAVRTVILTPSQPATEGASVTWTCTAGTMPANLRPAECRP